MKYAEGKWRIGKSGHSDFKLCIIAGDGGSVCHITNWFDADDVAKLIVCSREMHEALKEVKADINIVGEVTRKTINKIESLIKEIGK